MAIQTIIRNQPRKARFPDGFRVMQGQQEFITYPDHSSIRVWPSDQSGRFDSHFHSAVEIIMPSQGVSVCRLSDREYRVKADEILIIPANTMHELAEEDDILRYLILFEPAPLFSLVDMQQAYPIAQHPIYLQAPSETHREIAKLLHELVDCYFQQKPMWNTRCYACLLQVYALLAEEYAAATASPAEEDRRLIDPQIMNMAVSYIGEHFMEEISLEQVAAFTGYSRYYFSRAFKNYFGISYSDYLTVKRVNEAVSLLVNTDKPVGEIATEAGFGSIATFNRVFRNQKNCTPTRYRTLYGRRKSVERDETEQAERN